MSPDGQTGARPAGESAQAADLRTPEQLYEILAPALKRLANRMLERERTGHTLQASDLFHEAWIRVTVGESVWRGLDPTKLTLLFATAMRHVLIDHARRRNTLKRGRERRRLPLDNVLDRCIEQGVAPAERLALLEEIERLPGRQATVITLKTFAGYTVKELAEMVDAPEADVKNDLRLARARLRKRLREGS